jgi:phospholipase D1/2
MKVIITNKRGYRLEKEEQGGNWLYTLDQISPIEI